VKRQNIDGKRRPLRKRGRRFEGGRGALKKRKQNLLGDGEKKGIGTASTPGIKRRQREKKKKDEGARRKTQTAETTKGEENREREKV